MRKFRLFLLLSINCSLVSSFVWANLITESTRVSQTMQEQIQKHFDNVFGSKRSEVFVFIEMDYPDNIKQQLSKNFQILLEKESAYLAKLNIERPQKKDEQAQSTQTASSIIWMPPRSELLSQAGRSYMLPGFPAPYGPMPQQTQDNQTLPWQAPRSDFPFADTSFVQSLTVEIKRIFVKVLLDKELPRDAEQKIQVIIGMMFKDFNQTRGDRLVMDRVQLYHPMRELMRDIGFLGSTITGIAIVFVGSLALVLIFIGLITWRNYLRRRYPPVAEVFPPTGLGAPAAMGGPAIGAMESRPIGALPMPGETSFRPGAPQYPREEIPADVLKIRPEQIDGLYQLVGKESPSRVALIVARLEPHIRSEFLKYFEGGRLAQILEAMVQPQFIDPGIINQLKEKLQERLAGFFGGEKEVLHLLETSSLDERSSMLGAIKSKMPDFYKQIRSQILVFDDLKAFSDNDLTRIISRMSFEKLSFVLGDNGDKEIGEKILRCLPKKTADALMQMVQIGQMPKPRVLQAREEIVHLASRMLREGLVTLGDVLN